MKQNTQRNNENAFIQLEDEATGQRRKAGGLILLLFASASSGSDFFR
jgi:hypothetical protein